VCCRFQSDHHLLVHGFLAAITSLFFGLGSTSGVHRFDCWELFQAVEDIRGLRADPELSETERRVMETITAVALPVICLPAFVIGGISAFRL
jgi:hypothetical protein